jgi:hypothetical protein
MTLTFDAPQAAATSFLIQGTRLIQEEGSAVTPLPPPPPCLPPSVTATTGKKFITMDNKDKDDFEAFFASIYG